MTKSTIGLPGPASIAARGIRLHPCTAEKGEEPAGLSSTATQPSSAVLWAVSVLFAVYFAIEPLKTLFHIH